jgi:hypothetical protein
LTLYNLDYGEGVLKLTTNEIDDDGDYDDDGRQRGLTLDVGSEQLFGCGVPQNYNLLLFQRLWKACVFYKEHSAQFAFVDK